MTMTSAETIKIMSIAQSLKKAIDEASAVEKYESPNYNVESVTCGPGGWYTEYEAVDYLEGLVDYGEYDTDEFDEFEYILELQPDYTYKFLKLDRTWCDDPVPDDFRQAIEKLISIA